MSYNGIGLPTARGTGTSGHIQKSTTSNAYNYAVNYERRQLQERESKRDSQRFAATNVSDRKVDKEILQHERDREIEVKCMELEVELEEEGVDAEEIEKRVDELRSNLLKDPPTSRRPQINKKAHTRHFKEHQIHDMAVAKEEANERFKQAVSGNNHRRRRRERSLSPVHNEKRYGREDDERRFGDRYRPRDERDQRDRNERDGRRQRERSRDQSDQRDWNRDERDRDHQENRNRNRRDERDREEHKRSRRDSREDERRQSRTSRSRSKSPAKEVSGSQRALKPYY